MTTCGAATYTLFRSLVEPKKSSEVPIAELMKLAAAHYHPKPSLAVQRFCFNSRTCQAGESVAAYLAELKRLSEHCSFGHTLNDMLLDRIVCGIQDQRTQCRLLVETDLTLKKAFEVAQAIESADTQVKELQHPRTAEVHAVSPQFRQFRAPVPHSAPVDDRPPTQNAATHRDPSFVHSSRNSPSSVRPSFTPSQRTTLQRRAPLQPRAPCLRYRRMHCNGGTTGPVGPVFTGPLFGHKG